MSVYSAGTVNIGTSVLESAVGACAQLINRILQAAGTAVDLGSGIIDVFSAQEQLAEFHTQRDAVLTTAQGAFPELTRACALETALYQTPVLSAIARQHESALLSEARAAAQQAQQLHAQGETARAQQAAQRALTLQELVVQRAYDRLANAQQSVVGEEIAQSLAEMGYQVQRRDAGNRTAIWATRGAHSIAVVLDADGQLQMDMHGFVGTACRQERAALLQRLREKGVRLNLREATLHGDRHGGQWLKKALYTARTQKLSVPDALLRETARAQSAQADLRRRQQIVWGQRTRH